VKKIASVMLWIFLGLPLVWVLFSSLKPGFQILGSPWSLPIQPQFVNYSNAWREAELGRAFFTSVLICVCTLSILMPVSAMAAYVLARYPFRGNRLIFGTFLSGMMFPHFLVIVPLFMMLRDLHALNTVWGLVIVYVAYSLSFSVFVLHGFFAALPEELAQVSMLDGCTHAGTFWKVMLPLAKPGVIVVAIFNGIGLWNEYSLALVLFNDDSHRTLPLGLANLTSTTTYQADWGALFAGLVITMTPVMVIYWFAKDKIHEAMLAGAIK
jgi:N-acetylglucosamine transport system permease protein